MTLLTKQQEQQQQEEPKQLAAKGNGKGKTNQQNNETAWCNIAIVVDSVVFVVDILVVVVIIVAGECVSRFQDFLLTLGKPSPFNAVICDGVAND